MRLATRLLLTITLLFSLCSAQAEEVTIKHEDISLNALMNLADGKSYADGVVVILHGTIAHNEMEIIAQMQELLNDSGYSTLAINLGFDIDNRHGMLDCATTHTHQHEDSITEIGLWIDWLKQQGATKLALIGHSRGGNQISWFAAENSSNLIDKVVTIAPATWSKDRSFSEYQKKYETDLQPIFDKAEKLVAAGKPGEIIKGLDFIYCEDTSASAEAVVSYYTDDSRKNTPELLAKIKQPVLVFAGSEDKTVVGLVEQVEPIADGEKVQLQIIDGADHFFRDLYLDDVVEMTVEFLNW